MLATVLTAASLVISVITLIVVVTIKNKSGRDNESESLLRQEIRSSVEGIGGVIAENQRNTSELQGAKLDSMERKINSFTLENEQKLDMIRRSMEFQIGAIREDNNKQLEQMRQTVDEKLQNTLESRISKSFALVNERLEQVYKGLGEMQNLAVGVGDLKKVLSNVKTRGILGEIQLKAILSEIMAPEQYEENAAVKPGSRNVVEFAVKLPGDGDSVYLPIDSKFPGDTYAALRDAVEEGDKEKIAAAKKALTVTIKNEAKDIRDKYIAPPHTTDFAIMFLPFEGLYSEVVNSGLVETLQREYRVNVAGPGTMAALLNALQMGFKTLAVQKRSAEVWTVLSQVKDEFDKFATVLEQTQQRINQANSELDKLVGVRTRQIQRRLSSVQSLSEEIN